MFDAHLESLRLMNAMMTCLSKSRHIISTKDFLVASNLWAEPIHFYIPKFYRNYVNPQ